MSGSGSGAPDAPSLPESPYAVLAGVVENIIVEEFASEGFVVTHDKLHESIGWEGTEIGLYPISEPIMEGNSLVREIHMMVQFYGMWEKDIDPATIVDPRLITSYAYRLENAVRSNEVRVGGSDEIWYFDVMDIEYPDDPTGNISRFHAIIRAFRNNAGLVETSG